MLNILSDDKKITFTEKIKKICLKNNTTTMMYGAGVYSRVVSQYLINNGIEKIVYVIDDKYYDGMKNDGSVISFSEFLLRYSNNSPLVFGIYNYEIIQNVYKNYKNDIKYMFDFHFAVVNGNAVDWEYDYYIANQQLFLDTYNCLETELSRKTMEAYINAAVAGEFHDLFTKYRDKVPYFNDKLKGRKIDRLFDCGAFDGDSAHDYISYFFEYDHIFEFEPDISNIKKIKKRVEDEKIRDLTIIEKGVWSETTTLRFSSEGKSSSSISDKGEVAIDVIRLDDMFDKFTHNSLIKMDIEGSELEALKGARRVIKEISPALAICVYHKREDLITIPQYIQSLVGDNTYEYYLGYQGLDLAELVFYALPKEEHE